MTLSTERPVLDVATRHASLLRLRGMAAIAFALLAFFWPHLTLHELTILWASYSLVDGLLALSGAIGGRPGMPRLWLGLVGIAGIVCAGAVLIDAEVVAEHLIAIISTWAVSTGALQLWAALELRKAVDRVWPLAMDGAGAIAFGIALVLWPRLEMVALVWLVGWFAMLLGSLYLAIGVWLRR